MITTVGQLKNILNQYGDNCPVAIAMPSVNKRNSSYIVDVKTAMIRNCGTEIEMNKSILTELGLKAFTEGIVILGK